MKPLKLLLVLPLISQLGLPIAPSMAQQNPSCSSLKARDQAELTWYPTQPLPQTIAIDNTARLIDEINAIANTPDSTNPALTLRLYRMLVSVVRIRPPEAPYTADIEDLIKTLQVQQQPQLNAQLNAQLVASFDRLAVKLETLTNDPSRIVFIANLARYYQQLGRGDRAAALLDRATQSALKQPTEFNVLLPVILELGHSKTIAAKLPQIETAIAKQQYQPLLPLARNYQAAGNETKALALADRFAKSLKPDEFPLELITTYVKLNRIDKAKPYLDRVLKGYINSDDYKYGELIAAYEIAKQPEIANQLFTKAWKSIDNSYLDSEMPFLRLYFQAGGTPDRVFQALQKDPIERRYAHILRVAGEYRKRNQPQKSQQAIEQFIQVATQQKNYEATYLIWQMSDQGYVPEAKIAMERLLRLNRISAKGFSLVPLAAQFGFLDRVEPLIQGLVKSDPEVRIDLLQQLAIAYAQAGNLEKAVSIAERIPRNYPSYSPAIATLAQVAATIHKNGQPDKAQTVFSKALKTTAGIQELNTRAQAYADIAIAQTQTGQTEAAESSRQLAVQSAQASREYPNSVISAVSQQFLNRNQLNPAWKTFQAIPPTELKDLNIDGIAIKALELGDLSIAQQASDLIAQYHPPRNYASIAPRLVRSYLGRGQTQPTITILDRAAQILANLPEQERSPDDLEAIVRLQAQTGQLTSAQALIAKYPRADQPAYAAQKKELQTHLNCYKS